jgi:hypothetical protein
LFVLSNENETVLANDWTPVKKRVKRGTRAESAGSEFGERKPRGREKSRKVNAHSIVILWFTNDQTSLENSVACIPVA